MINAIIFANRNGYNLFERSIGFPEKYCSDIKDICGNLDSGRTKLEYQKSKTGSCETEIAPALRYMPIENRYLLSVIFRCPNGNSDESRGHAIAVNFLMDAEDADAFFALPFTDAAAHAKKVAVELLKYRSPASLPDDVCQKLLKPKDVLHSGSPGEIPLKLLLTGADYGMARELKDQLFLQTRLDPIGELHNLIHFLPPSLRRNLRFHTDCLRAQETDGISICYSSILSHLVSIDFDHHKSGTKHVFFSEKITSADPTYRQQTMIGERMMAIPRRISLYEELLCDLISSWAEYKQLSALLASPKEPKLEDILNILPDDKLGRAVKAAELSEEDLARLKAASAPQSRVRHCAEEKLRAISSRNSDRKASGGRNSSRKNPGQKSAARPQTSFNIWKLLPFSAMTLATALCLFMLHSDGSHLWALTGAASGVSTGYFLRDLLVPPSKN